MSMGYVYCIEDTHGHVKIGYTGNLSKRIGKVTPSSPFPCDLSMTYKHKNARKIESTLHKILIDCRMSGEWFDCSIERVRLALPMASKIIHHKANAARKGKIKPIGPRQTVFSYRLSKSRVFAGFTQASFAAAIGVCPRRYAHWEQGEHEPSLEMLNKIARKLGTTPNYLIGFDRPSELEAA